MSEATTEQPPVTLVTADECSVQVPAKVAQLMGTVNNLIETLGEDMAFSTPIPLTTVLKSDLQRVLDWLAKYPSREEVPPSAAAAASGSNGDESGGRPRAESRHDSDLKYRGVSKRLSEWERRFFRSLPKDDVIRLLNTANYLDVPSLCDAGSAFIAEQIKDMTVDEARAFLNIENDLEDWSAAEALRDEEVCRTGVVVEGMEAPAAAVPEE